MEILKRFVGSFTNEEIKKGMEIADQLANGTYKGKKHALGYAKDNVIILVDDLSFRFVLRKEQLSRVTIKHRLNTVNL